MKDIVILLLCLFSGIVGVILGILIKSTMDFAKGDKSE